MKMKLKSNEYMTAALGLMLTLMAAACSGDTDAPAVPGSDTPAVVYPVVSIGVTDMECEGVSRAIEPMSPDVEKYVKTLAVFEFDNEGIHGRGDNTFHFIDFQKGTVDDEEGVLPETTDGVVESALDFLPFNEYTDGTICLVANVTMVDVENLYGSDEYHEPGQSKDRLTFNKFCTWNLKIGYLLPDPDVYDETYTGHVDPMYMFGFYKGPITSRSTVTCNLGRLVSRIDLTVVNETGEDITKRLGYHFDNVVNYSYFFPMRSEMPQSDGAGKARIVICSGLLDDGSVDEVLNAVTRPDSVFSAGSSHTRYFYLGAHSASSFEHATKVHLFYDRRIVVGADDPADMTSSTLVPLCNIQPDQASGVANGYSLSRNTRYNFVIRLRKRTAAAPANPASRTGEPGAAPGEYIVYLP